MIKIAILGSPRSGKSTIAKTIESATNTNVYYLDSLFWENGWVKKTIKL